MRGFSRWAMVVVAAGIGVAGCGGLPTTSVHPTSGGSAAHPLSYSDDAVLSQPIRSVRLNTDAGSVTITGKAGLKTIDMHRIVHNGSDRQVDATTKVGGGVLTLGGCEPQCAVDYTLLVPAGTVVNGATTAGSVTLSSVSDVDVTTEEGDLTVSKITTGQVSLHSTDGRIRGTELAGSGVVAVGTDGEIDIAATTAQNVTAQLENGIINVTVPSQAYRVTTAKDNGRVSIGVPNDPASPYQVNLTVQNGDISLQPN